jgi:hypothetical protein
MSNDHNLSEEQLLSQLHLLDLEQRHLQIEIERARIKVLSTLCILRVCDVSFHSLFDVLFL